MIQWMKKIVSNIVDWVLYTLLSERQKEKIANLFTERQKAFFRKLTAYGKRRQQRLYILNIKNHLYTLGLRTQALKQLEHILQKDEDPYLKRLAAWELVLWYANDESVQGAKKALTYINHAADGEKDRDQLRRIAIMEAECYGKINEHEKARQAIQQALENDLHPDLYLALANIETDIERRLHWLNKVYAYYELQPITFSSLDHPTYDHLQMKEQAIKVKKNQKVTVLLPAYNAGEGLKVAVDSILSQTWENLELIIIDDCSTDHTLDIARHYEEKDSRVIVTSTGTNSGPYVARNIGLEKASGDYITVNDADDWSHEQKIEVQARHLNENPHIIANTSAHARLTEQLTLYRRGTPGRYLFPNMSSIMFRRKEVCDKLGSWDSVRFAADGEFKRRLLRAFGEESFVDLQSGPLSLPRQSVSSLTASSAFGYHGFFMGVRKEYVESFEHYYKKAKTLYYPFPQTERLYPVPEPMWPKRQIDEEGRRNFDLVIAADFREKTDSFHEVEKTLRELLNEHKGKTIGLMQKYTYNLNVPLEISEAIRKIAIENKCQMLVFGEKINSEKLLIIDYNVLLVEQMYIPTILPKTVEILIKSNDEQLPQVVEQLTKIYACDVQIIPFTKQVREQINNHWKDKWLAPLAKEDWVL